MGNKIDSNIVGLYFAEEQSLKVLPGTNEDGAVWYGLEPNSFSDFGGNLSTVARSPIDPSRQNKKGTITDLEASGGFNIDFTKSNLLRLLQGFFFADARQMPTTKPLNGAAVSISGVAASTDRYSAASGLATFVAGHLVYASGFTNPANNGLKAVVGSSATYVEVPNGLVDETPTSAASLSVVGRQFATGDVAISVASGIVSLTSTVADFTAMSELFAGLWIFIGGDGGSNRFANNRGYARIASIAAHSLVFDDVSWTPATEAGTGLTIQIFIGTVIKNEKNPSLIKRRSYNLERTLGLGPTSTQAEYLIGAVPNEFTLNVPQAEKLNADLSFVACDNTYRSGEASDEIKLGTRISPLGEDAFNTSSDIYRIKLSLKNAASSVLNPLFAYVTEANVSINNNVTPNKAVGVLGAFDTSAGNFEVAGSITAYFSTVDAVKAVRSNADVGLSMIMAAKNAGFIFDIPLLGLGGGRLSVEKDAPITVPLEPKGAENPNGYTLLFESFSYLPNLALPS